MGSLAGSALRVVDLRPANFSRPKFRQLNAGPATVCRGGQPIARTVKASSGALR
jgi:hypothetical protein